MIIYFLRHGEAGSQETWQGDDRLRPLTPAGIAEMRKVSRGLSRLDLGPDLILHSPLTRARQTAEIAARRLNLEGRLFEEARLSPGFDAQALAAILHDVDSIVRQIGAIAPNSLQVGQIMLVGHEPSMSSTVSAIIRGGEHKLEKAGLARVNLTSTDPVRGELAWLAPPEVLVRVF